MTKIRSLLKKPHGASFSLDGQQFTDVQLRSRKSGSYVSKAGRMSWIGLMNEQPIKCYECESAEHARFIWELSNDLELGHYFPECFRRIGSYLIVEWIVGEGVTWRRVIKDESLLRRIAGLQASFHARTNRVPALESGYDYQRYLWERMLKFKNVLPIEDAIGDIGAILENSAPLNPERISHPDITADNLVIQEETEELKVIDNELLAVNSYYLIDLFNTHYSFGSNIPGEVVERYIDLYFGSGGDLSHLAEHGDFYGALWTLRLIGSALQDGDIDKALVLANGFIGRTLEPHPLYRWANNAS